jgi:tetratricopeptide (TPR) repeat protein
MRRLKYIIWFLLLTSLLYAERKIENIKVLEKGYYNFNIYLSELGDYDVKVSNNTVKLYFKNSQISDDFPGSVFNIESSIVDKVFLTRDNAQGVIINFSIDEESKYIIKNFEHSKFISLFIYKDQVLDEDDKLFINALQHEMEGDKEKALFEYRKLLAKNPNHSDALFYAGLLRKSLGYNYQSKANLSLSKTNGNTNPEISFCLSEIYALLGNKTESTEEHTKYITQLSNDKKTSIDFSIASIASNDFNNLVVDNEFDANTITNADSSASIVTQLHEPKVIKTIPVDSSSYYYSLIANILIVVVAIGSVVYICMMIRKRKMQQENRKKNIKIDLREKINTYPEPTFQKIVTAYNKEIEAAQKSTGPNQTAHNEKFTKSVPPENKQIKIETNTESDIDRLARKYQVERGKIELAMKILSKNETESPKDKYILFMKMLKDDMSLEDLASNLRIPKGELELVMNLKNI